MGDDAFALQGAVDAQEPRCEHHLAEAHERIRPDDDVGDAAVVFQGDEDYAVGAAGALAHQDQAGDGDRGAVGAIDQGFVAEHAAAVHHRAQQRQRVVLERQA